MTIHPLQILDIRTLSYTDVGSDRSLLRGKMRLKTVKITLGGAKNSKKELTLKHSA